MYSRYETLAITNSATTTAELAYGAANYGMVYVPSGSSINTLTFHAAPCSDGTFLPVYSGEAAVALTVAAGKCYALPSTILGARFIKMVGNAAGTVYTSISEIK
jgi:hypothetical protein